MRSPPGNDLVLGNLAGRNATLTLSRTQRDKHLYVCGGTGTGKSKFLEHLIRQDIKNWYKSRCGLILLDPHGSLYDSLIQWLAWNRESFKNVPIVPIDLRQDDWVISYNLLRQRQCGDPAVLVDNITEAMAYVWGAGGTDETPLFARWAGNVLRALYEKKLTLVEAEFLIDRLAKRTRYLMTSDLKDKPSRDDWLYVNTLSPKDFESQIGSTVNRLQRFLRNSAMRTMFGQPNVSLDLGRALEEGSIILVSLATERGKISKENAELFATVLLNDLWNEGSERGKRENVKPFYVYCDEFQRFVSPTIAEDLDQARGYGLHLTLAHQFPLQLTDRGDAGNRVYHSIMESASSKVVFRLTDPQNLEPLAKWLFMGVMNPDEVKHEMYSTRVMEYREELREIITESDSVGRGVGWQSGIAAGSGWGGTMNFYDEEETLETSLSVSEFSSGSENESESFSESSGFSRSLVPTLIPILGKELSHVQFRSLEEQVFRAMAVLFSQQQRFATARIVEMNAPVTLKVPEIHKPPSTQERTKQFLDFCYAKLPYALPTVKARAQIEERAKNFPESLLRQLIGNEEPVKRRIR